LGADQNLFHDVTRATEYQDPLRDIHSFSDRMGDEDLALPPVSTQRSSLSIADGWDPSPFRYYAAKVTGLPGWRVTKMPCGHDIMVDLPLELVRELVNLA
jgi:hypothetical protein